ncbi:hypothetical protein SLS62_003013 [Diatrype stigma]|uniref:Vacuolar sorting protein Vps3844 C-terminal domain-containing protein n=1 Tax=Diatrype stigma TaxID=117547 RepID=A0AAN9UT18_9PEZI
MRLLTSFVLPALAGIASAGSSDEPINAEAYILRQPKQTTSSSSSTPSIPHELAQAVLLQRLSTPEQPSVLGQLSSHEAEAVDYINQFGKPTRPLFAAEGDAAEPKQLVIAFSGVTDEKRKTLRATTSSVDLSFTSPRLSSLPAEDKGKCAFAQAIDPKNSKCWNGKTTQYLQYDAVKDAKAITELGNSLATLKSQATSGEMETVILVLAPSSPSDFNDELRRRQFGLAQEQVLTEHDKVAPASSTTSNDKDDDGEDSTGTTPAFSFAAKKSSNTPIPACFASYDACMSGTSSCSGHGACAAKWTGGTSEKKSSVAKRDDEDDGKDSACYVCRCLHTTEKDSRGRDSLYRWGGAACQKIDVSTPFWLFAGVTIALVGTIAFSVSLLFGIGEEKLPGVIGAGVSRGGGQGGK